MTFRFHLSKAEINIWPFELKEIWDLETKSGTFLGPFLLFFSPSPEFGTLSEHLGLTVTNSWTGTKSQKSGRYPGFSSTEYQYIAMQVTFKKNPIMVKQLFPTNHIFYLNIFPLFRCDKEGLKKYAGYLFLLEQNNVREGSREKNP